jgi:hypothetical protein
MPFDPQNLTRHADFVRFNDAHGTDYEVFGDDSRLQLAFEIAETIESLKMRAEALLYDFMKHAGEFALEVVEIFEKPGDDGGIGRMRYSFMPTDTKQNFGYTYFDIIVLIAEHSQLRFTPSKLVIGFW